MPCFSLVLNFFQKEKGVKNSSNGSDLLIMGFVQNRNWSCRGDDPLILLTELCVVVGGFICYSSSLDWER